MKKEIKVRHGDSKKGTRRGSFMGKNLEKISSYTVPFMQSFKVTYTKNLKAKI
jgi:hypothetical protein